MRDPFYAVDSRDYQVITPNHKRLREMGAKILAIENTGHTCLMNAPS